MLTYNLLTGITVIRAFGDSGRFLKEMVGLIDDHSRPKFMMQLAQEWVTVRYNMLSSLMVFITISVILTSGSTDAATVGFVMAFVLNIHEVIYPLANTIARLGK